MNRPRAFATLTGTLLISLTMLTSLEAIALTDFKSRNEVGLGFTDNAELTESEKKSDLFLRIVSANRARADRHQLVLRLSMSKYFKQSTADVFGWRISDRWSGDDADSWKFSAAVSGQSYPSGALATTDSSFDNVGADVGADRESSLGDDLTLTYGAGGRLKRYTGSDDRSDATLFVVSQIDRELGSNASLGASFELGLLGSSRAEYSLTYLEFGGLCDWSISGPWSLSGDVSYRQSMFMNRSVTLETAAVKRRGRLSSGTVEARESYGALALAVELVRELSDTALAGFGLTQTMQSSRSGLQDYSALELLARLQATF